LLACFRGLLFNTLTTFFPPPPHTPKQKKKPAAARRRKGKVAARGSDEGSDSDRERERGSGATAAARRPGRELSVVEQALQKLKRNRAAKLPEKEVQERTQRLIDIMEAAAKVGRYGWDEHVCTLTMTAQHSCMSESEYVCRCRATTKPQNPTQQEDRLALAQGRPGLSKVSKLQDVLDLLKSKHLQGALVDNGQLLGLIKARLSFSHHFLKMISLPPINLPLSHLMSIMSSHEP
jgi:hypothetical protein